MNFITGSRIVVTLIAGLSLTGCAKVRYPTNYVLNLPAPLPRMAPPDSAFGPVVVRSFRCPDYICQGRIVYRPTAEELGFYEYHRWASDPREAITKYAAESLRRENVFVQVATYERGIQPAYILAGGIDRLEEIDNAGDVRVICALTAQLIDARTGKVIWSDAASEIRSVDQRNVAGVVRSLSSAAQAAVDALTKSVAGQMGAGRTPSHQSEQRAVPGED